jgi:hypothetical protein
VVFGKQSHILEFGTGNATNDRLPRIVCCQPQQAGAHAAMRAERPRWPTDTPCDMAEAN